MRFSQNWLKASPPNGGTSSLKTNHRTVISTKNPAAEQTYSRKNNKKYHTQ